MMIAGWNDVSTRMVAERAQLAPGVMHYHYSSMTDLLIAVAIGFAEETAALLGAAIEGLAPLPDLRPPLGRPAWTRPAVPRGRTEGVQASVVPRTCRMEERQCEQ
ncbi:TetR family transcriptional regulator [Nonomuraea spiralis]|uniref:TetR family transcriptional regulator n=1 Tax=Nonomuraea spiralis TaxID=46182 RepID=UPI003798807A